MGRDKCHGFQVLPVEAFYAVHFDRWEQFFDENQSEEVLKGTNNSVLIHVWNQRSSKRGVKIGSKSAYGVIAEQHCPKVIAAAAFVF